MNPAFIELTGSFAACLTTAAFFPQAIKTIRDRTTAGLSLTMYLMLVAGVVMWLTYGLLIGSWPLIIANSIVILPQVAILVLLLRQVWNDRNGIRAGPAVTVQGETGVVGA
jgi:MtN3 and saliva related transmembrane protein